jgi:uncharacterized C2H2 Zn-finger protein
MSESPPGPTSTTSLDTGPFRCKTCETSFSSKEELGRHTQQAHERIGPRASRKGKATATSSKRTATKTKATATKRKATTSSRKRSIGSKKRRK